MSIQNKKKKVKGYREEQRIEIACESKMRGTINYMENGWITRQTQEREVHVNATTEGALHWKNKQKTIQAQEILPKL